MNCGRQRTTDVTGSSGILTEAHHNIQRKAAIIKGGPLDHYGSVVYMTAEDFDLTKTIFKTLGGLAKTATSARLGVTQYWKESKAEAVHAAYENVPRPPNADGAIIQFMKEDCDFSCEHADGSFMDHLFFCHDYSATHFKGHSPRVLFLHSILGVGTNMFPMPVEKLPKLQSMLTEFEFKHVEAFPGMLRLLLRGRVTRDLNARMQSDPTLKTLNSISFHKVLDNKMMTLSAEDFWVHMNYQLIHMMDFLPTSNWTVNTRDSYFQVFLEIYELLVKTQHLVATVNLDLTSPGEKQYNDQPMSLGALINRNAPAPIIRGMMAKGIARYSSQANHDLDDYKLDW